MNPNQSKQFRILAIAPSTRGFGFAVMEGQKTLIAWGVKVVKKEDKNAQSLAKAEKLMEFYKPNVLVLPDVMTNDARRNPRIRLLHQQITVAARKRNLKVALISGKQLRSLLLCNVKGTKHEMAEKLAEDFPDELASRLPPKRRPWASEDSRMDIFDAAALAVTCHWDISETRIGSVLGLKFRNSLISPMMYP